MIARLRQLLSSLRRPPGLSPRVRTEVDLEIREHLEMRTQDLIEAGMEPAAARAEAERRFGDPETARRELYASARRAEERERWGLRLDALRLDARVALRRIRSTPAFSALSVATFALGIGLTTTMFAVLDATVIRPLPFPQPEELVALYSVSEEGAEFPWVSATNWLDWKEQSRTLAGTAMYAIDRVSVTSTGDNMRVPAAKIGGAFFEVLGASMRVGRPLTEAELDAREPVVVVSERFWNQVLGGDGELGEVVVSGLARRVVGVVDARHTFPEGVDVWMPAVYRRLAGAARNNINWQVIARIDAGATAADANTDLDRIAAGIRAQVPEAAYSWGVGVVPLKNEIVGDADRTMALLMGAVLFVLLVACSNLAGQAYARSLSNLSSGAVRRALGATRWRVVQGQLAEHLVLALLGGIAGTGLALLAVRWLRADGLPLPRAYAIAIEPRVLAFAVLVSVLAGLLAGLAPALRVARAAPRSAMGSVRGAGDGAHPRAAAWLVAAEIALSMALLIGGGVLLRGFLEFTGRDLGYDPDRLLVAEIELDGAEHADDSARQAYWSALLAEVRTIPGVATAALANEVPGVPRSGYGIVELADRPDLETPAATYRVTSDGYFRTQGLGILVGRDFEADDAAGGDRVVVVSAAFARTYWEGQEALGKQIRALSMESVFGNPPLTVIGVVEDLDAGYGRETRPAMYVLHRQVPLWTQRLVLTIAARGNDASSLAGPLRERLRQLDPTVAADVAPLRQHLATIVARDQLVMTLLTVFALLTLGLAALGVHGLLSFAVARRTREIAIRTALGANPGTIMGLIVGNALRLTAVGAASGALASFWLSGLLRSQVTDIDANDPVTFAVVLGALLAATLGAASVPAWRALRLDPARALRAD